jgi:predicted DCC family thiol-disulfide oxidoreductase YuxK
MGIRQPAPPNRIKTPPPRPLMIFDGDCGFCRGWISRWKSLTGTRVDYAPSQEVTAQYPEISPEEFKSSVQLVTPDGVVSRGAEAVLRALAFAPGKGWLWWLYQHSPWFAWISEILYALVARNRNAFSKLTTILWGRHLEPSTFITARWLFLRSLALVYFVAFVSLWTQIHGLIGTQGILPAQEFLDMVRRVRPDSYPRDLPTLAWLGAGDGALNVLCGAGVACSIALLLNVCPTICLAALWMLYLSLFHIAQDFLGFQWDTLLLETGFLAIFVAPLSLRPRMADESAPPGAILWLIKWLLFRLMFSSGMVKLLSGDATWWNLSALQVHYETQPLPTWTSWYIHHAPAWFHFVSCFIMFFIELVVPFMIFGPRRVRHIGGLLLIALQIVIVLTGNYGFFNWLAMVLCIPLFDDFAWPAWLRDRLLRPASEAKRPWRWPRWILAPLAVFIFLLGGARMLERWHHPLPTSVRALTDWSRPLLLSNGYGLFEIMTTERPEIVIEGSDDGQNWREYEFKYKPGDLKRRPEFVAPHQPRLDWQMWFAALSDARRTEWFLPFLERILQGKKTVLDLFETNPFPDKPPRYIRAVLYNYRFSDPGSAKKDGVWWKREKKGLYVWPFSLNP